MLIINGSTDLQVPVEAAEMLHSKAQDAQLKIIEGMNHVLKPAPMERSENLKTYNQPNLPLADELKESIKAFLAKLDEEWMTKTYHEEEFTNDFKNTFNLVTSRGYIHDYYGNIF